MSDQEFFLSHLIYLFIYLVIYIYLGLVKNNAEFYLLYGILPFHLKEKYGRLEQTVTESKIQFTVLDMSIVF